MSAPWTPDTHLIPASANEPSTLPTRSIMGGAPLAGRHRFQGRPVRVLARVGAFLVILGLWTGLAGGGAGGILWALAGALMMAPFVREQAARRRAYHQDLEAA